MRGSVPPLLHTLLQRAQTTARSSPFATKTYRKDKQNIYLSFKKKCGEMEIQLNEFLTCAPDVCDSEQARAERPRSPAARWFEGDS
jgi:hypothetical protein